MSRVNQEDRTFVQLHTVSVGVRVELTDTATVGKSFSEKFLNTFLKNTTTHNCRHHQPRPITHPQHHTIHTHTFRCWQGSIFVKMINVSHLSFIMCHRTPTSSNPRAATAIPSFEVNAFVRFPTSVCSFSGHECAQEGWVMIQVCQSISLSVCLPVCLFVCLSVCLCICLSFCSRAAAQAIQCPRTRSAAARQVSNTHERDLVTAKNV